MSDYKKLFDDFEKVVDRSTNKIELNKSKTADRLKKHMAELYEKHRDLNMDVMTRYNRLESLDKTVNKELSDLFTEYRKETNSALRSVGFLNRDRIYDIIRASTGREIKAIKKVIDVTRTVNDRMAGLKWTERLSFDRSEAIYRVQRTLKEGLEAGDGYGRMAERLTKELDITEGKAKTIVRTEAKRVHSTIQQDSADLAIEAGLEGEKKWITSDDERVRSSHRFFREQDEWIDIKDEFVTPLGSRGVMPGLLRGPQSAKDNINCRCFVEFRYRTGGA